MERTTNPDEVARKDASAESTILRLHALLESLGFPRAEADVHWWSVGRHCHSCHVRFRNYPLIAANGKGTTKEWAYASAVAEFTERLQCSADALFTHAGDIHRLPPIVPRSWRKIADLAQEAPWLLDGDTRPLFSDEGESVGCLPFADLLGHRVVDLPYDTLLLQTGSNGMCAGNSPEEAITQGLCEVFERAAIQAVVRGRVPGLPTWAPDRLPVRSAVVRAQLEALQSGGVQVLVKDASLGGQFPVLAVVLLDRRAGRCEISFGSDPDFDVALSRCLTEAFQGKAGLENRVPSPDPAKRPLDTYNRLVPLLEQLLPDAGRASGDAFCRPVDNGHALAHALKPVRRQGLRIYVRDWSIFGFPSYYVYVEELSGLHARPPLTTSPLHAQMPNVRRAILGLYRASRDEVTQAALTLYGEATRHNPHIEWRFFSGILQVPAWSCVDLRTLLVLMLIEGGRTEEAADVVDWPPLRDPLPDRPARVASALAALPGYVQLRGSHVDNSALLVTFDRAFGPVRPVDVTTVNAGPPLRVPRCESVYCCPSCPCRPSCRLDEWHRLARRLRAHVAIPNAADLLTHLECASTSA